MRQVADRLADLINGHFSGDFKDKDITVFIHKEVCEMLVESINYSSYDFSAIDNEDCEFYFISSVGGESKRLFVEKALNESGLIIHNETDVLITGKFLTDEIASQLKTGVYSDIFTMDLTGLM